MHSMFTNQYYKTPEIPSLRASVLFYSRGSSSRTGVSKTHIHGYWQMEINIVGNTQITSSEKTLTLQPDDIVLIPPGVPHEIHYPNGNRETWSIKFEISNLTFHDFKNVIMIDHEDHTYRDALLAFLKKGNKILPTHICNAEYLIASLVEILSSKETPGESVAIEKIQKAIRENINKGLSVSKLAKETGYSPSHLGNLLRNELGVSPKNLIDQERLKTARECLLYSELNISEISDHLGFPDLFAFSRFFKRLSGQSPSAFRKTSKV